MIRIHRSHSAALSALLWLALVPGARAQGNFLAPVDTIDARLHHGAFTIVDERGSRFEGDRTSRMALKFGDGEMFVTKWAPAAPGGEAFNNSPRYEVAAYQLQRLFLDNSQIVVPPTVLRAFPLVWYRTLNPNAHATFLDTESVVVALQYWLFNVTPEDFWQPDRVETDTAYARAIGNFNLFTYLVRHSDSNAGNFLISRDSTGPRVYSVDNGVAFASEASNRGAEWRRIRVKRLPRSTVERLRTLTEDDLTAQLETVAEFRIGPDRLLESVPPGPNLSADRGVRRHGDRIQLGLTRGEIHGVWRRLQDLLEDVDRGRYELF